MDDIVSMVDGRTFAITVFTNLSLNMPQPPTYVALVHITRLGKFEQLHLLNNTKLNYIAINTERAPEWLLDAVAMLQYCDSGKSLATEQVTGYKYSDFMIAVCITKQQYNNLLKGA